MRGKGKYKNSDLAGILRYIGNRMTNSERNAFERELQKDPFLEEATEGFSEVSSEQAREDLINLRKRLKVRTIRKQRFIFYRIAASVAGLMVITSLFILIERGRSTKQVSGNIKDKIALAVPIQQPLTRPEIKEDVEKKPSAPAEKKEDKTVPEKMAGQTGSVRSETIKKAEDARAPEIKEAERIIIADEKRIAAPAAAIAREETVAGLQIRGKVISEDDKQPIPGASVMIKGTNISTTTDTGGNFNLTLPDRVSRSLEANYTGMESKEFRIGVDSVIQISLRPSSLALNEAVTVSYEARKSKAGEAAGVVSRIETDKKVTETDYNAPEPLTGRENFDRYIEDNMRCPEILKVGDKAVVVVSFVVMSNGTIDSIKIIRSPGRSFSDEAIRLIKNGPGWKPSTKNGEAIDDEVRIRIVFK